MQEEKDRSEIMKGIEIYFILYILLQPILDVTAFVHLPVSEPVRVLSMIVGIAYILFFSRPSKEKTIALIYIGIAGLIMALNLLNNFVFKDPFSISVELIYTVKTIYVVMMMIVYYFILQSISQRTDWSKLVKRNIFWGISIVSVVMVLATVTGTGKRSYGYLEKEGHSGWFFSGNEISAILAMGFAIMLLYFMNRKSTKDKLIKLPLILITIYSLLTVGTKVALGSVVVILGVGCLIAIFEAWKERKWFNVILLPLLLIGTLLAVPYSAVGNNLGMTLDRMNQAGQNQSGDTLEEGETDSSQRSAQVREVLSSRGEYFAEKVDQYKEANWSQKLLGMGRGGNYEEVPKLVEMDFFDWFFNFGMIGFLVLVLPIVFLAGRTIWLLIKSKFKLLINPEILLVGVAVALGLGAAFMAGHVLSSPASGIYLSILLVYIYREAEYSVAGE